MEIFQRVSARRSSFDPGKNPELSLKFYYLLKAIKPVVPTTSNEQEDEAYVQEKAADIFKGKGEKMRARSPAMYKPHSSGGPCQVAEWRAFFPVHHVTFHQYVEVSLLF